MKNLLNEIRKCAEKRYVETCAVRPEDCDADGNLHLWFLLNLVENMHSKPAACVAAIAPMYKKDVMEVTLQLYGKAQAGDKLELEARFYEIDRRQVELKIFVRKVKSDGSSKRVCRAGYVFKAVFEDQRAA
jgi:hypothetical protein